MKNPSLEAPGKYVVDVLKDLVLQGMGVIGRPCSPLEISEVTGIPRGEENPLNDAIVTGALFLLLEEKKVKRVTIKGSTRKKWALTGVKR